MMEHSFEAKKKRKTLLVEEKKYFGVIFHLNKASNLGIITPLNSHDGTFDLRHYYPLNIGKKGKTLLVEEKKMLWCKKGEVTLVQQRKKMP